MDDGKVAPRGGGGDNGTGNGHERGGPSSPRRKTLSGAIPLHIRHEKEKKDRPAPIVEAMKLPWTSPSAPTSPTAAAPPPTPPVSPPKSTGHKRTFSGSILARFSFLKSSGVGGESGRPPSRGEWRGALAAEKEPVSPTKSLFSRRSVEEEAVSPTSPKTVEKDNALAGALKQSKTRKRKTSLRKTALLGGRRGLTEGRERKGSFSGLLQKSSAKQALAQQQSIQPPEEQQESRSSEEVIEDDDDMVAPAPTSEPKPPPSRPQSLRRQFSYESPVATSSDDSIWSEEAPAVTAARLALVTEHQAQLAASKTDEADSFPAELGSPLDLKSPTSQASYASTTTDDDDVLTFSRPSAAKIAPGGPSSVSLAPVQASYFPSETSLPSSLARRRAAGGSKRASPLSRSSIPVLDSPPPEPHDYTETEYWGWVILFATWLTFTVGMGSCLEIWSWAWDVGQTPYAPPELEDDPTLPIVGYYPALMVLTGVVAWVWITVAWVGMKYFRHAKIEV